ncbi:MAG: hypothetical protein QGG64_21355 [Candidatus Latescibacteria bacterium]|nr:hypothetical protein [Candidatus Latescibacterota bacterium]
MEWFNITWIFGIITIACAFFFLQMLLEYNNERGKIMPQLRKVRDIRKRHEGEIEKVDGLAKDAEEKMVELDSELDQLKGQTSEFEEKVAVLRKRSGEGNEA